MNKIHIATYQDAAKELAKTLPEFPGHAVVVRLGGNMPYAGYDIQINTAEAINNSINKLKQKNLLLNAGLKTLPLLKEPQYPCVVKGVVRSMGTKVFVTRDDKEYRDACRNLKHDVMIEPLFNTTSEYRLHCTQDEVFFAVKKIKENPLDIIVTNRNHYNIKDFVKPRLWEEIKAECLKAIKALGLDICCFDVLYDSSNDNQHKFTIAEANTNPELLTNTYNAYNSALAKLIRNRIELKKKEPLVYVEKPKAEQPPVKDGIEDPIAITEEQRVAALIALMKNDYKFNPKDKSITILL